MDKEKEQVEEIQKEKEFENKDNSEGVEKFNPTIVEIEQYESAFSDEIEYEEISSVETSPMNEAVKKGEVSEGQKVIEKQLPLEKNSQETQTDIPPELLKEFENDSKPATDAPEQEIDASDEGTDEFANEQEPENNNAQEVKSGLSEADHHAGIAADSLMGVADNLLETGGGFFIKIKKSKDYHDFDKKIGYDIADPNSLNAKIEEFNEKNIKRIKLDEEDKRQLKPVLKEVLKRQTKAMTPEQQLIALGISILIKKGKAVIEMRNESKALKNHFDDVVKEYFKKMETIKIEVVEKKENVKEEELKREDDGEKGEDNQVKQAA